MEERQFVQNNDFTRDEESVSTKPQKTIQETASFTSLRGHELIFRRPLMRDMKGINPTEPSDLCELAKRCVTNISPNDWENLDASDSLKASSLMTDFLLV